MPKRSKHGKATNFKKANVKHFKANIVKMNQSSKNKMNVERGVNAYHDSKKNKFLRMKD